jgi:hypothetical protein
MSSLKFIHTFQAYRTEEVEKVEVEKRENEEVKVTKKVKEEVPYTFGLLKPGRSMKEEAEIFHAGLMNEYVISRGLMTRQQLLKRYANDGGSMSEPEKKRYAELLAETLKQEEALERVQINLDNLKEEEKEKKIQEITEKLVGARVAIQEIISAQNNLYEHTAETKAEEKTIFWWMLKLAYIKKDNKDFVPYFGPGSIEERVAKYDELEESEDSFSREVIKRFLWYVSLWYNGQVSTEEDFKRLESNFKETDKLPESKQEDKTQESKKDA